MARSAGSRRSGPGYAGLIIFIVLCMALIGGYVWLVPEYTFAVSEMQGLNSDIKQELEDRLGNELGVHAQSTAKRSERAYDTGFLREVGDSAVDGLKYADLVELCGWEGQDPILDIQNFLKSNPDIVQQGTLRDYCNAMSAKLAEREELRKSAEQGRQQARSDMQQALSRMTKAEERATKAEREKNAELSSMRDTYQKDRANYIKQMDETNAIAAQARKDRDEAAQKHREQIQELDKQIESLQDRIVELENELLKKKPQPVKVVKGKILEVDLVNNFVIINLGKRDGITVGETFSVMQVGLGGVTTTKATLQVTKVLDIVSHCDIIYTVPETEMIVPEDLVHREKTEEAPE